MDCREFENKLWDNPSKYADREKLSREIVEHLESCSDCSAAYDEFLRLFQLSANSELNRDDTYWEGFENKVWDKIETAENKQEYTGTIAFKPRYKLGFGQLFASLVVAAGTVVMLMLAVSNIADKPEVTPLIKKAEKQITLEQDQPGALTMHKRFDMRFVRDENGGLQFMEFSLLPEPEVNVIDDSSEVRIDAAYLTDDGLDEKTVTVARASIQDVERGSGKADTAIPRVETEITEAALPEYIVRLEKMPRMIKAVPPDYPPFAYKFKRGGDVWIKAYVDADGSVRKATVYRDSGSDYGFEEAALNAAYKNKFEPFEIDSKKTPVWVIYKVSFISKE